MDSVDYYRIELEELDLLPEPKNHQLDKMTAIKNKIIDALRKIYVMENNSCKNMYYISGGLSFLNIMKFSEKNIDEKLDNTKLSKYIDYFKTYGVDIVCKGVCFDYIRVQLYNILATEMTESNVKETTENNRSSIYVDDLFVCKIINENILEKRRDNMFDREQKMDKFKKWPQTFMRFQMILNLAYNKFLNKKYYDAIYKMENKHEIINAIYDILCGNGIEKINKEYKNLEDYYVDNEINYMGLLSIIKRTVRSIISGLPEIKDKNNLNEIAEYIYKDSDLVEKNKIIFYKLNRENNSSNMVLEEKYIFNDVCNEIDKQTNK